MDIVLVSMPFAEVQRPSIALGLLRATLANTEIESEVIYGNFGLAETIGLVAYQAMQSVPTDHLLGEWCVAVLEKTALAGNDLDDALVRQLGVGLGNGVAIDAQLLGELAHGWQRLPALQTSRGRSIADLIHQLQVGWLAGFEINVEEHIRLLSQDTVTVGGPGQLKS